MVDMETWEKQAPEPAVAEAAPVAAAADEAGLPLAKTREQQAPESAVPETAPVAAPPTDEASLPLTKEELEVLIDPVAKAKLAEHKKAIIELLAAGGPQNAWEVGEHIATIVSEKLATRAGYRHLASFVIRELPACRTSIKKYRRLHRYFSQAEITEFGVERLTWLHAYRSLTGCGTPLNPADLVVDVPNRDGGTRRVRFADCSRSELRAAMRIARLNQNRPTGRRLVEMLDAALVDGTGGRVRASALYGRRSTKVRLNAFAVKDARGVAEACRKLADEIDELVRADSLTVL